MGDAGGHTQGPAGKERSGMVSEGKQVELQLSDGSRFRGSPFGFRGPATGEVVFNTGMVGYPETLTDPSYKGQILVFTYPLIGNYGVPAIRAEGGIDRSFESDRVQVEGLIVSEIEQHHNHWNAVSGLDRWLREQGVPVISGIDTRELTKRLRMAGSMPGRIVSAKEEIGFSDPNGEHLVRLVSVGKPERYLRGPKRVVVIDCGCKNSIIHSLLDRDLTVIRVPWDHDFLDEEFDGVVISNGPGDPKMCGETIFHVREAMAQKRPILGICLGNQILALAAGGDTSKMKFGHRGQNQPCLEVGTRRCFITSQNHGFQVRAETLAGGWKPWFINANDGSNEGIRHERLPFAGVQFHPEASPGPLDTAFLFDRFARSL